MAEWYHEKIANFASKEELAQRREILTEIKLKLDSLSEADRKGIVQRIDLKPLFMMLLTSNDKFETEQICDAIANFSHVAEPGYVLRKHKSDIYDLISHSQNIARAYALGEMLVVARNKELFPQLLKETDLLVKAIEVVGDKDIGVAQIAMKILKRIGQNQEGIKLLYSGPLMRAIAKVMTAGDVAKFRVYDVVVEIAISSEAGLEASINSGYLHDLLRIYDSDDILLQLNVLQTMCELASTKGGLAFLEEQGFVKKLTDRIVTVNDNPLDQLLIPGLMSFFGHLAKLYPQEVFSKYPLVISALSKTFHSDEQNHVKIAIETFAHIASTLEGKYVLQCNKDLTTTCLETVGKVIQTWQTQYKVDALNSLITILSIEKSEQNNRSLELTKSWFNLISDKALEVIISLCKQPFADIRVASLQVFSVIASQPWGQEYIANYPGLIEFLLDRNIESFKESKEVKFQIVKNLKDSQSNLFDAETMQKIKQFVSEGPFYVDVVTEVALEGAS
ncbi:26S proteasome non-ATPase regulatory subunit 5 [Copidosoma floridanum]|uniref:26S proteasome non-ATPase regulatory subunit 5 n=1 Tax=Copidosoma floridanum TaxID=29053 RepID=UPI0006C98997|nr:26S proteasome non-ATPase regulatory subunit 5 [Copidosoma floridanum]